MAEESTLPLPCSPPSPSYPLLLKSSLPPSVFSSSASFDLCFPPEYTVEIELQTIISPHIPTEVADFLQVKASFSQSFPLDTASSSVIGTLVGVITKKLHSKSPYNWTKAWDEYSPALQRVREILFRSIGSMLPNGSAQSTFRVSDLEGSKGNYPTLFIIEKIEFERCFRGKGLGKLFLQEVFQLLGSERFSTALLHPSPLGFTHSRSKKKKKAMVKLVHFLRDLGFRKFGNRMVMVSRPWEPQHPCHCTIVEDFFPYRLYEKEVDKRQDKEYPISENESIYSEPPSPKGQRTPSPSTPISRTAITSAKGKGGNYQLIPSPRSNSKTGKGASLSSPASSTSSTYYPASSFSPSISAYFTSSTPVSVGSSPPTPEAPQLFHPSRSLVDLRLSPIGCCSCGGCLQGWLSIRTQFKLRIMATLPFETIQDVPVESYEGLYRRTCIILIAELLHQGIVPTCSTLAANMPPRVVSFVKDLRMSVEYPLVMFLLNLSHMDTAAGGNGAFQRHFGQEYNRLPHCHNDDRYIDLFYELFDREHSIRSVVRSVRLPGPVIPLVLSGGSSPLHLSPPLGISPHTLLSSLPPSPPSPGFTPFLDPIHEREMQEFFSHVSHKLTQVHPLHSHYHC